MREEAEEGHQGFSHQQPLERGTQKRPISAPSVFCLSNVASRSSDALYSNPFLHIHTHTHTIHLDPHTERQPQREEAATRSRRLPKNQRERPVPRAPQQQSNPSSELRPTSHRHLVPPRAPLSQESACLPPVQQHRARARQKHHHKRQPPNAPFHNHVRARDSRHGPARGLAQAA